MTVSEFQVQMQKLINCYGEKNYPEERSKQIWWWARSMSSAAFADVIAKVITENLQTPLLPKLQAAYAEIRTRHGSTKIHCAYCNGDGWYVPVDSPPLPTVYACRCENGEKIPKYVTRWAGELHRWVPTQKELDWAK